MKHTTIIRGAALALVAVPTMAFAVVPDMYEARVAAAEEARIIHSPIAGVQNKQWYNYRINIVESQKELATDLRKATDIEDQRDAYEEYGSELRHERTTYVKTMAKKGYRVPRVYIEG